MPAKPKPSLADKPLTNRERVIRLVGAVLEHPAISDYSVQLRFLMKQMGFEQKLRSMKEEDATPIIERIRDLVR